MIEHFCQVFLILGSNKGDREKLIRKAVCYIEIRCGVVLKTSSIFSSESWGYNDKDYLNQALEISTSLTAKNLLIETQKIEKLLGRNYKTTNQYTSRTIDIDILFYENMILNTAQLTLPHPRMHLRNFVLQPLVEIAPSFIHPIFKKNIKELAVECNDKGKVCKVSSEQ